MPHVWPAVSCQTAIQVRVSRWHATCNSPLDEGDMHAGAESLTEMQNSSPGYRPLCYVCQCLPHVVPCTTQCVARAHCQAVPHE